MNARDWIAILSSAALFASVPFVSTLWFRSPRAQVLEADARRRILGAVYRFSMNVVVVTSVIVLRRLGTIEHVLDWVARFSFAVPLTVVATMLVAGGLFWVRSRRLRVYAGIEYTVGAITAWFAISPLHASGEFKAPNDPERIMKIVAAIYLMIRAMDNWTRAQDRSVKDAVAPTAS